MRRLRSIVLVAAFSGAIAAGGAASESSESYIPPQGFVPDAATASRIAEAVWIPIYGEKHIAAEKPFKVTLREMCGPLLGGTCHRIRQAASPRQIFRSGTAEFSVSFTENERDGLCK